MVVQSANSFNPTPKKHLFIITVLPGRRRQLGVKIALLICTPVTRVYAFTPQRFLYVPPAGERHCANTVLAYFVEGCQHLLELSGATLFGFASDSNWLRWVTLVHLGVLFNGSRNTSAGRSAE